MALVIWAALDHLHQKEQLGTGDALFIRPSTFYGLLNSMLWWPDIRLLLLASEPGRNTVLRVYEDILVRGNSAQHKVLKCSAGAPL